MHEALKAIPKPDVPAIRIANKAQVAEFFAIEVTTLNQWIRKGCPYLQGGERGKAWKLDLLEVMRWRLGGEIEAAEDPETMPPKARLDWFRGSQVRDAWQVESGELIPADQVRDEWARHIAAAKSRLMAIPTRLAKRLHTMTDQRKIRNELRDAIADACERLADD